MNIFLHIARLKKEIESIKFLSERAVVKVALETTEQKYLQNWRFKNSRKFQEAKI